MDYSQSTAQNLMRIYQECGDEQSSLFGPSKAQALGNLSLTKVLRIIAIPEGPERNEFLETHDVEAMSTRELEAAMKERDAALRAAEQARAEAGAIRAQADQAEKRAALAANEDLVLFRTLFDQAQEQVNKLGGVLMKLRPKDPDTAEKLSRALLALSDRVKEAAQS